MNNHFTKGDAVEWDAKFGGTNGIIKELACDDHERRLWRIEITIGTCLGKTVVLCENRLRPEPLDLAAHDWLTANGYTHIHFPEDRYYSGDAETGPRLDGHPAYDEYTSAGDYVFIGENGAGTEPRDKDFEAWLDKQQGPAPHVPAEVIFEAEALANSIGNDAADEMTGCRNEDA